MSKLTPSQQKLLEVWQEHSYSEFVLKDLERTMATMTENPYVICYAVGAGGYGLEAVRRFYANEFFHHNPADIKLTSIFQTFSENAIIEEGIISFTHDLEMPWLLPGIAPTGRAVEFPFIGVISFEGGKISSERLYWDQGTLLLQLGVLDPRTPAVRGAELAGLLRDPSPLK